MVFRIYKHSKIASLLSILGSTNIYCGIIIAVLLIFGDIKSNRSEIVGNLLVCFFFLALGIVLQFWAKRIAEKKAKEENKAMPVPEPVMVRCPCCGELFDRDRNKGICPYCKGNNNHKRDECSSYFTEPDDI